MYGKAEATISGQAAAMTASPASTQPRRILVVDDDPGIRTLIAGYLERNGCAAETACDTTAMRKRLADDHYDLIVLDLMMPNEDGLTALRRLQAEQENAPPVIMLSAVGDDIDRIIGLEVGADDYLPKPCNPRELLARISSVLRRRRLDGPDGSNREGNNSLIFAGWRIDLMGRTLLNPKGVPIHLTDGEFTLLQTFVQHPRRVLTRDQLLDLVRGGDSDAFDRAIDVQVSRLRRKLGPIELIRTIRSEGYMFLSQVSRA